MNKKCWKCGKIKPQCLFNRNKSKWDGCATECRECSRAYHKGLKRDRRDYYRNRDLQRLYGINLNDYNHLKNKQGRVCRICGKPNTNGRVLVVDHDHGTNEVRGLLCDKCNLAIGLLDDNPQILRTAIKYLDEYNKYKTYSA